MKYSKIFHATVIVVGFGLGVFFLFDGEFISAIGYLVSCIYAVLYVSTRNYPEEISKRADSEDPWASEKTRLEKFWLTVYGYTINWNDFILPEWTPERPRLEIDPKDAFTAEQLYNGIVGCKVFPFKKRSKYVGNLDEALANARTVQPRPKGNYAFAHAGGDEPDSAHLGKSYDDAISAGLIFMGPREYLIACARNEFENGKVYDIKGITKLSVLDSGGLMMCGRWYGGDGSRLVWGSRDYRHSDRGPRVVVFTS